MTVVGFPLNAVTGAPAYTGEDMRVALSALEFGANAARPLGVRSGTRPGSYASASGFTWTVANHSGIVDVQTSATAGGYLYAITTAETGAITAANATHPRKDILTIRVDDPQEDATGTPLIAVVYTAGTAAATPVVPATPARSMVLARIDTPASGGGNPTVTWLAPVTVAAGGIVPVADNTARDALSTAYGATQTLYASHAIDGLITWPRGGSAWVKVGGGSADYVWANAAARTAQTGMIAGQKGYQTDTGITYRRDTSAWVVDQLYCVLSKSASQNLTTTPTALIWDVEASDLGGMHDNVTNNTRITVPVAGVYQASGAVYNGNSSGLGVASLRVNGSTPVIGSRDRGNAASGAALTLKWNASVALEAGDYLELLVSHATAAGQINGGTNEDGATITVRRLGPA